MGAMSEEARVGSGGAAHGLEGRVALVTGASRGIGRAVAEALAARGVRVVLAARSQAQLEAVAESLPKGAQAHVVASMDLSDEAAIETAVQSIRERVGHIDILVPNAGIALSAPYDKSETAAWDTMMAVNARSVFQLGKALIPAMTEAGWGRVVVVASNAGLTGYAYSSAYCASKHAVVGWMRAVALEVARKGVTVNALCPGWVDTKMSRDAIENIAETTGRTVEQARASLERMSPQGRMVQPAEVAHWVVGLCEPGASSVHGQALAIDGGQLL